MATAPHGCTWCANPWRICASSVAVPFWRCWGSPWAALAVVALLNIGHNAEREAMNVFKGMGSDLLVANVQIPGSGRSEALPNVATLDTAALRQAIPDITAAAPLILTSSDARLKGHALSTTILGSNADLPGVLDLQLAQGRFLSQFDTHSTHAVLGANVAAAWENAGIHAQPGDRIQIGGYLFQVIGILQPAGQNPLLPAPPDDAILLPLEGMRRIIPSPQITSVLARNPNGATLVQTSPALQQWVEGRMPGYEVNVQIPRLLLEGMAKQLQRLFSWLLAGLGSIALLVGGIGVMNVMVMNVAERRREIGVRMALALPQGHCQALPAGSGCTGRHRGTGWRGCWPDHGLGLRSLLGLV